MDGAGQQDAKGLAVRAENEQRWKNIPCRKVLRPPDPNAMASCRSCANQVNSLSHSQMYQVSEFYINVK